MSLFKNIKSNIFQLGDNFLSLLQKTKTKNNVQSMYYVQRGVYSKVCVHLSNISNVDVTLRIRIYLIFFILILFREHRSVNQSVRHRDFV